MLLPAGAFDIVKEQDRPCPRKGNLKLGTAFVASFLFALWSANGGMKAIIDASTSSMTNRKGADFSNRARYPSPSTFGGLLAVLIAIGTVVALPIVLSTIGLARSRRFLSGSEDGPLLIVLMLLGLALLYRFGPAVVRRSGGG